MWKIRRLFISFFFFLLLFSRQMRGFNEAFSSVNWKAGFSSCLRLSISRSISCLSFSRTTWQLEHVRFLLPAACRLKTQLAQQISISFPSSLSNLHRKKHMFYTNKTNRWFHCQNVGIPSIKLSGCHIIADGRTISCRKHQNLQKHMASHK